MLYDIALIGVLMISTAGAGDLMQLIGYGTTVNPVGAIVHGLNEDLSETEILNRQGNIFNIS